LHVPLSHTLACFYLHIIPFSGFLALLILYTLIYIGWQLSMFLVFSSELYHWWIFLITINVHHTCFGITVMIISCL
jgi:hypothetical protein